MCIILGRDPKINPELPSKELLAACWRSNQDGAGYMFNGTDGKVHIYKGFMELPSLLASLDDNVERIRNASLVVHFRMSTEGGVNRECTHPFPVTKDYGLMRQRKITWPFGVAHNGVFAEYSSWYRHSGWRRVYQKYDRFGCCVNVPEGRAKEHEEDLEWDSTDEPSRCSDTMRFIRHEMTKSLCDLLLKRDTSAIGDFEVEAGGNRIALLGGTGEMYLAGGTWTEHDKYMFSNRGFYLG